MPGPKLECGTTHTPPCPPDNALMINGVPHYTRDQMLEHGTASYHKGLLDAAKKVLAVINDPNHGWSEGEMARAIAQALQ